MDSRAGKEFLEYEGGPDAAPGWKLILDGTGYADQECLHSHCVEEVGPTGYKWDTYMVPRSLNIVCGDPYEGYDLCLDCLIDAMRQLGILTEKDIPV